MNKYLLLYLICISFTPYLFHSSLLLEEMNKATEFVSDRVVNMPWVIDFKNYFKTLKYLKSITETAFVKEYTGKVHDWFVSTIKDDKHTIWERMKTTFFFMMHKLTKYKIFE